MHALPTLLKELEGQAGVDATGALVIWRETGKSLLENKGEREGCVCGGGWMDWISGGRWRQRVKKIIVGEGGKLVVFY